MPSPHPRVAQAVQLLQAGKNAEARAVLATALAAEPGHAELHGTMAAALGLAGELRPAEEHARRAVDLAPGDPAYLVNLAHLLAMTGRAGEAVPLYRLALTIEPVNTAARAGLGNALTSLKQWSAAAEEFRIVLAAHPGDESIAANLASLLLWSGQPEAALAAARAGAARFPSSVRLAEAMANALNYAPAVEPREVVQAHERVGRLWSRSAGPPHANSREPGRVLRVGLLSADLRTHPVPSFVEPILRHRDAGAIQYACYSTAQREDAVSDRLRSLASAWRSVARQSDAQIAGLIRADAIDILVDLCGITAGHRMGVQALGPAPVQATYLGYPNTTGLGVVGYRVVDSHADGPDSLAVERLIRLDPCFLCFQPPAAPEPRPRDGGPITFGSFNSAAKLNGQVLGTWAALLREVPDSRIVLKTAELSEEAARERIAGALAAAGVERSRIKFLPPAPDLASHLACYHAIDIGLDTFPYNGTTTTLESLWMGVPVVTLEGRMHAGRVGVSLLRNAGLDELVAPGRDAYIRVARGLAADPVRLASMRSGLRARIAASALCDGPGFCRRFVGALRGRWREWGERGK